MIICNECEKEITEESIPVVKCYPFNPERKNNTPQNVLLCPECFKKGRLQYLNKINITTNSAVSPIELFEEKSEIPIETFFKYYKKYDYHHKDLFINLTSKYSALFIIYNQDKHKYYVGVSTNVINCINSIFSNNGKHFLIHLDYIRGDKFTVKIIGILDKDIKIWQNTFKKDFINIIQNLIMRINDTEYYYIIDKFYNKKGV